MVILEKGQIITDLYTKPTDKHIYVDRKSSHPLSVKKSLPYGLGIRLRRICSRESDYLKRKGVLKSYLRKRGYSSTFIESQLVKVDKMDRSDLLVYKDKKKNQNRVPLVVTYAKQLPDIQKISRDHMPLVHNSERMQHIFKQPQLVETATIYWSMENTTKYLKTGTRITVAQNKKRVRYARSSSVKLQTP